MESTFTFQVKGVSREALTHIVLTKVNGSELAGHVEVLPPAQVPGGAPALSDKIKLLVKDPVALASLVVSLISLGVQVHDRPAPEKPVPGIEVVLTGEQGQVTVRDAYKVDQEKIQEALAQIGELRTVFIRGTE